jgi:hypothetical protein
MAALYRVIATGFDQNGAMQKAPKAGESDPQAAWRDLADSLWP